MVETRGIFDFVGVDPGAGGPTGDPPRAIFDTGVLWYTGSGDPTGGADKDTYLDVDSGNVWRNNMGTWILVCSLRGPPGPASTVPGPAGDAGPTGPSQLQVACYLPGLPLSNQVIVKYKAPIAMVFLANFAGSEADLDTGATNPAAVLVTVNGAEIGRVTFTGTTPVFSTTGGMLQTVNVNDLIKIVAPASVDGTMAGIAIALLANKS